MRPKTARNESSRAKSTDSNVLARSSSAVPEGPGDRRPAPDRYRSSLVYERDVPGRGDRSYSREEPARPGAPPCACPDPGGETSARSSSDDSEEERWCLPRRREERPGEGDLLLALFLARLSVPSLDDRLRRPRERDSTLHCCSPDTPGTAAGAASETPALTGVTAVVQVVTAPPAAVDGHATPPDPVAEAVTPAMPPITPWEEDPDRLKKNLARSCTTDGSAVKAALPATGVATAAASETTGGCEATASTPSWVSRLASRPVSTDRKRSGEPGNRTLDRERSRERFGRAGERERSRRSPRRAGERIRKRSDR